MLNDLRALAFLDRVQEELAQGGATTGGAQALVRLWRLENKPSRATFPAAVVVTRALAARLTQGLGGGLRGSRTC